MPESEQDPPQTVWRPLPRERPWYRTLASQDLAEGEVRAPDGHVYLVRVTRNSPVVGPRDAAGGGDPIAAAVGLVKANLGALGDTGWTITVLKPGATWRAERPLYRQPVGAKAIVVDVVAITDALARGDILWDADER